MTAEEIRKDSSRRYVSVTETTKPEHEELFKIRMIQEGVAQLADLNAVLNKIYNLAREANGYDSRTA